MLIASNGLDAVRPCLANNKCSWTNKNRKYLCQGPLLSISFFHAAMKSEHTNPKMTQSRLGNEKNYFHLPKEIQMHPRQRLLLSLGFDCFGVFNLMHLRMNKESVHFKGGVK